MCLLVHRDRVVEIPVAVVKSREEMAVKINRDANTADYRALARISLIKAHERIVVAASSVAVAS